MKGPNDADLWWSWKHRHHGGNIPVLADPAGFPIWVSGVRPGREHDTTCAKAAPGLLAALAVGESEYRMPTLTDLGYLNLSPAIRHPFKKPKRGELTEAQITYNTLIAGVHCAAERANALLKETFAALQPVSLSPTRIGAIAKAARARAESVSVISELGFQAAEMRVLGAQLAEACAGRDVETACDLAEELLVRQQRFSAIYRTLLLIARRTRTATAHLVSGYD